MNLEPSPASIDELVRQLPEIYQPIYGHPDLSVGSSRPCEDRMGFIATVHQALCSLLGRPVKVLDLGCSQGYFSIRLAQLGAEVFGVDFLSTNVSVCNALASEHPALNLRFAQGRIEDVMPRLEVGDYDLVLGLSVFHHVICEHGGAVVSDWLNHVAQVVNTAVFEFALSTEPLYWAAAQPNDIRTLLSGYSFVYELGRIPTHLSDQQRPLYVASNYSAVLGGNAYPYQTWKDQPHALAQNVNGGSRRYFFGPDSVIKLFSLEGDRGEINRRELAAEVAVLTEHGEKFAFFPKLFHHELGEKQGWLARERIAGEILLDLMTEDLPFDDRRIVGDVLQQLAQLERQGLYHNDVRPWNVVVDETGVASLIDFGSITTLPQDCVWPQDIFIAFFIFLREVSQRKVERVLPQRQPYISPYNLPQPYRALSQVLWSVPRREWSFQRMHEAWPELRESSHLKDEHLDALNIWIAAAERHIDQIGEVQGRFRQDFNALHEAVEVRLAGQEDESRTRSAAAELNAAEAQTEAQRVSQSLLRLEDANQERLELLRHISISDHAHAIQIAAMQEQSVLLRQSLMERERLLVDVNQQLDAAQANATHLELELAQQRSEAERSSEENETRLNFALAGAQTELREAVQSLDLHKRASAEHERSVLRLEQKLRDSTETLSGLRNRTAQMLERHEEQVSFYVEELEQSALRVAASAAQLHGFAKRSPHERRHARFVYVAGHPIVTTLANIQGNLTKVSELIMDAPLFTRMNFQPVFAVNPAGEYRLDDFLVLHDRNFVRSAYAAVLRRDPDPDGEAHYLQQVRSGESKAKILHEILSSPEGLKSRTVIHGLRAHILLTRACEARLIGRLVSAALFLVNVNVHLRDLRVLENHVIRIAEEAQNMHESNIHKLRVLSK